MTRIGVHAFLRHECVYCGCARKEGDLRLCMFTNVARRIAWRRATLERRNAGLGRVAKKLVEFRPRD